MGNINITDKAISKIQEVLASQGMKYFRIKVKGCLLYTSPSPRDVEEARMPSSA